MDWYKAQEGAQKWLLEVLLKASAGNVNRAALAIGIHHSTFFMMLKRHNLCADDYRSKEKAPKPKPVRRDYDFRAWADHKQMLVLQALEASNWNKAEAARRLDICNRTMHTICKRLKAKGVEIPLYKREYKK